ncbi:MAG TPA: hypothetical protein VHV75_02815 [Solirubrobacteraceae bacterium]|nr:hypothetical protein [Solirubrobacteraceae bacterium]
MRPLLIAPALVSLVGAVYLVLIAVYSRPIADDWQAFSAIPHEGLLTYVHGWWLTNSGRFSEFVELWVSVRVFGTAAVTVTTLATLIVLWAAFVWGVRVCALATDTKLSATEVLLLGLLAAVATLATAPSLFDTVGWYVSSTDYEISFTGAVLIAALCAQIARADRRHVKREALLLFAVSFVTAGFHEIVGIVGILAAIFAITMLRSIPSPRRVTDTIMLAAAAVGASSGTALNVFSPGSDNRGKVQRAHIDLTAAAHTAWHNLSFFRDDIHDGIFLLAVASGVLAWQLLRAPRSGRARAWLGAWGCFLVVVPWLLTSALTAWAGSTESGDRSPFRAAFLFTGSATIGFAILVFLSLCLLWTRRDQPGLPRRGWLAPLITLLVAAGGVVGFVHKAAPIVTAERLRAHAVAERKASVAIQLAQGHSTIRLMPTPLLTVYTQAFDLSFGSSAPQRDWPEALRRYYGIPAADRLEIVARQPRDYCLPNVAASWVGVQSCRELDGG